LDWAITALAQLPHTAVLIRSPYYRSAPMLAKDNADPQPDYINAVVKINTDLAPLDLLDQLQALENQRGRRRDVAAWSARPLDLDILLYADWVYTDTRLTLPHRGLTQRNFVLLPLFDCQPDLYLPDGQCLGDLVKTLPTLAKYIE